jgi:hypothetical protein
MSQKIVVFDNPMRRMNYISFESGLAHFNLIPQSATVPLTTGDSKGLLN